MRTYVAARIWLEITRRVHVKSTHTPCFRFERQCFREESEEKKTNERREHANEEPHSCQHGSIDR